MREARSSPAPSRVVPCLLALLFALLLPLPAVASPGLEVLDQLIRVRELMRTGDYERALTLARTLATQQPGAMFRHLPEQVLAERGIARGDGPAALDLYRRLHPGGGCLIAHLPSYWNSCQRMVDLYASQGDRAGQIEMLRLLAHGAGLRDEASPGQAYLDLAAAYDRIGEPARAVAYYRTALHAGGDRRVRRRSEAALERFETSTGEPDEVILHDALSSDPLLQRAGRAALSRLSDPLAAFESLLVAAVEARGQGTAVQVLVQLPLADLEPRLRDLLHNGEPPLQEVAQAALRLRTGLTYPYVSRDGEVHGGFDESSPFYRVWGAPYLVERMEDPYESRRVRLMALDALGSTGDPRGLERILPHTANLQPAWRVHAVHALRGYGGPRVEETLVGRLTDDDPLVRLFAAAGVARRRLPDAPDLLGRALAREENPLVAAALAEALGAQGPDAVDEVLAGLARQLGGLAAAKAGEALCRLGDQRGLSVLEAIAEGPGAAASWAQEALDGAVFLALEQGTDEAPPTPLLDQLAPPAPVMAPPAMPRPDSAPEEIFAAALLGIPPPDAPIQALLESPRWSEFRGAAIALANAGVRSHLHAMRRRAREVSYAADGSTRIRYHEELLEAIGHLRDDGSLPLLREVLASPGSRGGAQAAAARALGRLGDVASAPLLLAAFTDPVSPDRVRRAAAAALARLNLPEIGPLVLGGLESPDPAVRRWTLLLLRDSGSGVGAEMVRRLSEIDPEPELRALAASLSGDPSLDG